MRLFVSLTFLSTLLLAAEPSVFGAGNLNNPQPYGLTAEEKLILENKQEIQAVVQKNNMQNAKVDTVAERLDGLQAIIEGLGQSVNEHKMSLQKLTESSANDENISASISDLRQQTAVNGENITQLKTLLEELSHVVDSINSSYVSKEEFSALVKQLKLTLPAKTETSSSMDPKSLEKKAKSLFDQRKFAEAQTYYEALIQKKYKIAEANFWLGETYYKRQDYKQAISYYKESASHDDKASYMPTLLLHTGYAMEKTGDVTSAKAFYKATISKYSSSGAANEAQGLLSKLK